MIQSFSGTRKASQSCGKLLWIGRSIDGPAVSWIWVKQAGQEDLQVNEGNKWEIKNASVNYTNAWGRT